VLVTIASSANPLLLAVVSALAALAGGIVSASASALAERRRWRREREVAAEARQLEIRQATRLIEQELVEAEQMIIEAAARKEYRRAQRASTATWNDWRPYLARHLGVADWRCVATAFVAVNDLNLVLATREAHGSVVVVRDQDKLRERLYAVKTASHILRLELAEGERTDHWAEETQALLARLFGDGSTAAG
jgi:hypothetical protein